MHLSLGVALLPFVFLAQAPNAQDPSTSALSEALAKFRQASEL